LIDCRFWLQKKVKKDLVIVVLYFIITQEMFCECCGMQLRAHPRCGRMYKEEVRTTKKKIHRGIDLLATNFRQ
jgi:hypothetical protein